MMLEHYRTHGSPTLKRLLLLSRLKGGRERGREGVRRERLEMGNKT